MSRTHSVTLLLPDGKQETLQVEEASFILDSAADAGIELPHTCLQGWCVTCAGQIVDGTADCVDQSASLRYFPEDPRAGYVLLCTASPRSSCRIQTHRSEAMKAHRRRFGRPAPRG